MEFRLGFPEPHQDSALSTTGCYSNRPSRPERKETKSDKIMWIPPLPILKVTFLLRVHFRLNRPHHPDTLRLDGSPQAPTDWGVG